MEIEKIDRIIEMAWEDRTPFEAIKNQFGFDENEVIKLMRNFLNLQNLIVFLCIVFLLEEEKRLLTILLMEQNQWFGNKLLIESMLKKV